MRMLHSRRRPRGRATAGALAVAGVAVLTVALTAGPAVASGTHGRVTGAVTPARDTPAGFYEGTDSWPVTINGPAPYSEPGIGGEYGGYIGMVGNWAYRLGCHGKIAWAPANAAQANTNYTTYHEGIGTGAYWFAGGPGVDPDYNGTTTEAYDFGEEQASWALGDIAKLTVPYPVVFMDVELPGIAPAVDNGWNTVYTSPCSGKVKSSFVATALDRADFNGFAAYLTTHSSYKMGVYSAPGIWQDIFGTGTDSLIPNTYEWTYTGDTSSLSHVPSGWCLTGEKTCAGFYGGQTSASAYALAWQWSGGGGTFNGFGDFDQLDTNRTP